MATYHGIYSVRLQDFLGVKGSAPLYFRVADTHTIADIATALADVNLILDPLTDAKGISTTLQITFPTTNLKSAITVNNRLESGGLFTFQQAGILRAYSATIPAFAEAQIVGGKIDLSGGSAAMEFIGEMLASGSVLPKESQVQNLLASFSGCRLNNREYRKADTRLTSET